MMNQSNGLYVQTDEQGRLILPPEVAAAYGIMPDSRLRLERGSNLLKIKRSVTQLNKLYIEVTDQCNLDCRTCVRHAWNEPMGKMSQAVFTRILEGLPFFSPVPSVFFGGFGEPLLHPEIINMITSVKVLGAPVELITNGTLLTRKMSGQLIEAGLDVLWVSIDGARPESYTDVRLGAALPEVLRNIEQLNDLQFGYGNRPSLKLGIAFVAMKRNIEDLPEVARIARNLGASYLMVTNVLPYTPDLLKEVLYYNSLNESYCKQPELEFPIPLRLPEGENIFDGEFGQPILSVNLPRMDMNENTHNPYSSMIAPGMSLTIGGGSFRQANNRCPFIENGCGSINWDGNLSPCLPLMHSYIMFLDIFQRHSQRWIVGNILDKNLFDLWHVPEHLNFRERVQAFDFPPCTLCGGCDLIGSNEKDCFNNDFPTCGGCLWAQGFIQCP
jgi:MoaA/NifB/PqqE/SkfB family radical SAM enzyme